MLPRLLAPAVLVLLTGCAAVPPPSATSDRSACATTALRAPADPRIGRAIEAARREHQAFGHQTIGTDGRLSRVGYHEAEWARPPGETAPAWARVASYWQALDAAQPPTLQTRVGRVERADAERTAIAASEPGAPAAVAVQEALLRAAIVDTPWSAAFISYLMKAAGFTRDEFAFSDSHADYVGAALQATAAEEAGQPTRHAFRACDLARTRPRAGDLVCATRAGTAGIDRFEALAAAMGARLPGRGFPMHCDLVVRSDTGGDGLLETIGGNVVNSVSLSQMTLDASKVLSPAFRSGAAPDACAGAEEGCPEHFSRRPWLVLLQLRH